MNSISSTDTIAATDQPKMQIAPAGVPHNEVIAAIIEAPPRQRMEYLEWAVKPMHPQTVEGLLSRFRATDPSAFDIYDGFTPVADLPPAKDVERLWLGIFPGCVTLLNGETGAGKSVVLLNIAVHAALNEELWGIPFGAERPLRVLYVDPENAGNFKEGNGGIVASRLERMGKGRPEGLFLHDGRGLTLSNPAHVAQLTTLIQKKEIDLLILDPYVNLFGTVNENDNREAYENMKVLNTLSRTTNCAVVLCHHTGKVSEDMGGTSGKFGRGASSLLGAADFGMTLRVRASNSSLPDDDDGRVEQRERTDVCRLKVEKNRLIGHLTSVYLQMAGNEQFNRVTAAEFFDKGGTGTKGIDKVQQARELFDSMISDDSTYARREFLEAARSIAIGRETVDAVLEAMVKDGSLTVQNGPRGSYLYQRPESSMQRSASLIGDPNTAHWESDAPSVLAGAFAVDPVTGETLAEQLDAAESVAPAARRSRR